MVEKYLIDGFGRVSQTLTCGFFLPLLASKLSGTWKAASRGIPTSGQGWRKQVPESFYFDRKFCFEVYNFFVNINRIFVTVNRKCVTETEN